MYSKLRELIVKTKVTLKLCIEVYGGLDPRVMERSTVQVPVRVGRFAVDGVPEGAVGRP